MSPLEMAARINLQVNLEAKRRADEWRRQQEAEKAKQLEADKALLASEPKVSKYEPKDEPDPAPAPAAPAPAPAAAQQGFGGPAQ